ncbi:uncharacterized protein LOC106074247 [Biomphalaria glabrata]|uniref:Uncharacterized protein LOC106074247 n=1 Tax=Biomphalaria glabrata TaxID=6526 RepID=A0A9W2Z3V7_BIOGL|nr:uncharacterized protein LOC106074247 [Biomphalaria glabrata]
MTTERGDQYDDHEINQHLLDGNLNGFNVNLRQHPNALAEGNVLPREIRQEEPIGDINIEEEAVGPQEENAGSAEESLGLNEPASPQENSANREMSQALELPISSPQQQPTGLHGERDYQLNNEFTSHQNQSNEVNTTPSTSQNEQVRDIAENESMSASNANNLTSTASESQDQDASTNDVTHCQETTSSTRGDKRSFILEMNKSSNKNSQSGDTRNQARHQLSSDLNQTSEQGSEPDSHEHF